MKIVAGAAAGAALPPRNRAPRIRILVLGPPVGYPRSFDLYHHHQIEVMVSGPEVARALMEWVSNVEERKRTEVQRAAAEYMGEALTRHVGMVRVGLKGTGKGAIDDDPTTDEHAEKGDDPDQDDREDEKKDDNAEADSSEAALPKVEKNGRSKPPRPRPGPSAVEGTVIATAENGPAATAPNAKKTPPLRKASQLSQNVGASATLSNVTGDDLAKEVRAILLNQQAVAVHLQKQKEAEPLQKKKSAISREVSSEKLDGEASSVPSTDTNPPANTAGSTPAHATSSGINAQNQYQQANGAPTANAGATGAPTIARPGANIAPFRGIEEAAKISRDRQLAARARREAEEEARAAEKAQEDDGGDDVIVQPNAVGVRPGGGAAGPKPAPVLPQGQQPPAQQRKRLRWHALVDSGMGRLGFKPDAPGKGDAIAADTSVIKPRKPRYSETIALIKELHDAEVRDSAPLEFFGMCTHMADATSTSTYTHSQMERFLTLLDNVRAAGISVPTVSTDNSAALLTTTLNHFDPSRILSQPGADTRKIAAKTTGLHGIVSQKNCTGTTHPLLRRNKPSVQDNNEHVFRSKTDSPSMVAIENHTTSDANVSCSRQIRRGNRMRRFSRLLSFGRQNRNTLSHNSTDSVGLSARQTGSMLNHSALHGNLSFGSSIKDITVIKEMRKRAERVKEIDRMICRIQKDVVELQCEKDDLQRRPNPLYNYTSVYPSEDPPGGGRNSTETCLANRTVREFNFPPPQFADAYIEDLVDSGRLIMLNHTQLWQRQKDDFDGARDDMDEDELAGGLPNGLSSSSNARISDGVTVEKKYKNSRGSSGSWFLRQSLGRGLSLGEKIGETVELAAYRAVCTSVMSILARGVSALHGVNVMTHSDIRIFVETAPDLPPVAKGALPDGEKYAEEAIRKAIRRSAKKRKKKSRNYQGRSSGPTAEGDEVFLQRDAVIETLISHCQISAPLLKLFPLSWQRALLGNIITLVGAIVSDFVDGIQIQILGHQLSLSFKPITEKDVMNSIVGFGGARHRASVEEFEAAVEATARDVSKSLEFLDRWHERALGGGVLRAQIGNLVARVVLTLTDEVLGGAKFDLWSAQIGGPRIVAGLEHRIEDTQT